MRLFGTPGNTTQPIGSGTADEERDRELLQDLEAERQALAAADAPRMQRMRQYRAEAESHRDGDPAAARGDYGRGAGAPGSGRHDIRLPYAIARTIKHAYRAGGHEPDLVVDRLNSEQKEVWRQNQMEQMLYHSWGASAGAAQVADAAWDGSLLGSFVIETSYDFRRRCPVWRTVDPASVSVVPGHIDPLDLLRAYRTWMEPKASVVASYKGKLVESGVEVYGYVGTDRLPEGEHKGGVELVYVHEMKDRERTVRWCGDVALSKENHGSGFCPLVVVPNIGPTRMIWGYSDYELVRSISAYYDALLSRQADVIRRVANGTYTAERTGLGADVIKKALNEGGVLPVKEGGAIGPIEVAEQPSFVERHVAAVEQAMNDLGFTPPAAWGNQQMASGSAAQMGLQPQSELARLKQTRMATGFERVNSQLLKLWETKHAGTASYRGSYQRGLGRRRYAMTLGPDAPQPAGQVEPTNDPLAALNDPSQFDSDLAFPGTGSEPMPTVPKEIIDGDYDNTVVFRNQIDVDDPQFVMTEVNKFNAGLQSAQTTLERLGFQAPEDELALIESESQRFPWMRNGMIALIQAQLQAAQAAASGGGAGEGMGAAPPGAMDAGFGGMMAPGAEAGASNMDALATMLNGNDATGRAPGAPAGMPFGQA